MTPAAVGDLPGFDTLSWRVRCSGSLQPDVVLMGTSSGCVCQVVPASSRRDFLRQAGGGFGELAAAWLLESEQARSASGGVSTETGRLHFPARATRVISLFMHGGPSHLETFDPKPELQRLAGRPLPPSFGPVATRRAGGGQSAPGDASALPPLGSEWSARLRLPPSSWRMCR